ncbi:MAG: iron uptake porin [Cyanobacteria bacterium SBC]|nr:iron uptake porin [Cyanobacteria bacterium SBC]
MKRFVLSLVAVLFGVAPIEATALSPPRSTVIAKSSVTSSQLTSSSKDPLSTVNLPVRTAQVTSVSQLSDVQPTDWAYQALQSLIERYGCLAGVPGEQFQGMRALTRYEFAAGLNACLDRFVELPPSIAPEDLATIRRLQAEFETELQLLRGRIDDLESRVATLESQQFSTTIVMGGESIFALSSGFGGDSSGDGTTNTVLTHLTRLGFVGSFTGRDRLRFELQAANFDERGFANPTGFNSDMALLSFQGNTENEVELSKLEYRFATFSDRVVFTIRPVGFSLSSVLTANSPYFDAGRGSISRFTEASPAFKLGRLESGLGFDWLMTDTVRLQVAYGVRDGDDPEEGRGLFNSEHSALGVQLLLKPSPTILAGLSYINAYSGNGRLDTFTGSFIADTNAFIDEPAQIHTVSGTLQWRLARDLTFSTWGAWFFTDALESEARATTTTYLFALGYSDPFGNDGDLLAFLFGQPPKLVDGENLFLGEDEDTSLHFELFYRWRLNDNISITPGIFIVTHPEHDSDNEALVVGTIRTTFRF